MISFQLNGMPFEFDGDGAMPLLWVLRDVAGLTGTKYGCGAGLCGACTVHVDGRAQRSCVFRAELATGREVTTIEGLSTDGSNPLQRAWREMDVPQCGFCQPGQIMAAADLLTRIPRPDDSDISLQQTNLCRCGTYVRIRKAIHRAAEIIAGRD